MKKDELLLRIGKAEVRNGRTRYGSELRQAIVEYAGSQAEFGRSLGQVAGELGIKPWTVQRWMQNARKAMSELPAAGEPKPMSFVRLESAPAARSEPLEVLRGGTVVRIPVGFDAGTLSRVLTLLEGGAS